MFPFSMASSTTCSCAFGRDVSLSILVLETVHFRVRRNAKFALV